MRKQRICGAVKLRKRNNIVAQFRNVDDRVFDRGHSGTDAERIDSSLKRSHAFFQHRVGGIADASVDIPLDLQIE